MRTLLPGRSSRTSASRMTLDVSAERPGRLASLPAICAHSGRTTRAIDAEGLELPTFEPGSIATRKSNQKVLNRSQRWCRIWAVVPISQEARLPGRRRRHRAAGLAGRNLFFGVRDTGWQRCVTASRSMAA